MAGWVGGLLDHDLEDGFEEAGIMGKGGAIVGGEGGFDGLLGGRSNEFESANEDANGCGWSGSDAEGKNGIHEAAGNDVDEAGAFFEPGVFPGFEHGVSFVGIKTLGDEEAFEVAGERVERAIESGWGKGSLILQRAEDAVAEFVATALEENHVGDLLGEMVLELHGIVGKERGGEGR